MVSFVSIQKKAVGEIKPKTVLSKLSEQTLSVVVIVVVDSSVTTRTKFGFTFLGYSFRKVKSTIKHNQSKNNISKFLGGN